jgi:hypothetical protein
MFSDRDVHDASSVVREEDEHEQQSIRGRRDDEEVSGHHLLDVGREERSPRLRRRRSTAAYVLGDGGLAHGDAKLPQFAMDPRGPPERIGVGHGTDQGTKVGRHAWPTRTVSALPGPKQPEASPVPGDNRGRLHEH